MVRHPLGLDLPGGGLHVVLELVVLPLLAGLVSGTRPLVTLPGVMVKGSAAMAWAWWFTVSVLPFWSVLASSLN